MADGTGRTIGGNAGWNVRTLDLRDEWAIEIIIADLDGDGLDDILSGSRWYRAPDWAPAEIPGIAQVIHAMDVDGDGRLEVIGTRGPDLTARLCWAKLGDAGWTSYDIGEGGGDWPHGVALIPDHPTHGRALITTYHGRGLHPPEVWGIPEDPTKPWHRSTLADIAYSEALVVADLDGDGRSEIVAGPWWLAFEDGVWVPRRFAPASYDNVARVRVADIDGDGRLDIVLTEESGDWERQDPGLGRIAWFQAPDDLRGGDWTEHVIAQKKCPHSLDLADVDGDGGFAILIGEHDAFTPDGRDVRADLSIFRPTDATRETWVEEVVDSRFEHFDGAKTIRIGRGIGIVSHGWKQEPRPLNLWTRDA